MESWYLDASASYVSFYTSYNLLKAYCKRVCNSTTVWLASWLLVSESFWLGLTCTSTLTVIGATACHVYMALYCYLQTNNSPKVYQSNFRTNQFLVIIPAALSWCDLHPRLGSFHENSDVSAQYRAYANKNRYSHGATCADDASTEH
jgi:hypothetical protein